MQTEPLTAAALSAADCVAILTEHRSVDYDMVLRSARLIVDTRNAIAGKHAHVIKLGAPAPRFEPQAARPFSTGVVAVDANADTLRRADGEQSETGASDAVRDPLPIIG
jgi:hypothetical protein